MAIVVVPGVGRRHGRERLMAVIALGLLSPANIAVLTELKKPKPNPAVIQKLMKRFIFAAGFTGTLQIAILVIMTRIRVG